MAGLLPTQAIHGRHALHHHHGIPGGDAVVMLTPAIPHRPIGLAIPVTPEIATDPRPPLDVLTYWANTWRAWNDQPTQLGPSIARACDYLDSQLHHIAKDPIFPDLAKDLTRLTYQLETILHSGDRPDISRVPCWECGTRLNKIWADDDETHDHWKCPACGDIYDQRRYENAKYEHLASKGAEKYVNLIDAVAATGRSEHTVRDWVKRGLVRTRRTPGRLREVWWPDIRERDRATPTRKVWR